MDAVAIRELTRSPASAVSNGRAVEELPPDADPTMTREARLARAEWRLDHPDEWRRELEALGHFDPEFIYDVAQDYGPDWTTDPDYGAECVDLWEYDEDGVVSPMEKRAWKIQERMTDAAADPLSDTGLEADYESEVRFRPDTIAHANRITDERHHVRKGVRADFVVRSVIPAGDRERFMPKGILRIDRGAPVPQLVLEVVSKGSADRDLHYKKYLYEAAGIPEYLVYDLGGKRWSDSPRELLMYRLEGGEYRQVEPEPKSFPTDPDTFWSDTFGTTIRMLPDAREHDPAFLVRLEENRPPPRFQWWDAEQGRWRDQETDAQHKRETEQQADRDRHARELRDTRQESRAEGLEEGLEKGRAEGRAMERRNMAVTALRELLGEVLAPADLDRVEEAWRESGPPTDYFRHIKDTLRTPSKWRSLLLPNEPDA